MKLNKILAAGVISMSLAAGIGVGIALANETNVAVDEVKATDVGSYNIYLQGNFNGIDCWNTDDSNRKFTYNASADAYELYIKLYTGDTFKAYSIEAIGTGNVHWISYNSEKLGTTYFGAGDEGNGTVTVGGVYKLSLIASGLSNYGDVSYLWNAAVNVTPHQYIWAVSDDSNWTGNSATTRAGVWGGCNKNYHEATADYVVTVGSYTYYRIEVESDITGVKFLRYNSTNTEKWNETGNCASGGSVNHVYDLNNTGGTTVDLLAAAPEGNVSAALFGKALELINTCSSDSVNGYGAYSTLETVFYDSMSRSEVANLESVEINDYIKTDYDTYGGDYSKMAGNSVTRSGTTNAKDKWETMASLSGVSSARLTTNMSEDSTTTMTIAASVIAVSSIVAAGGFFLLRRRTL
ncbi:MAG: hypothetical protein K6B65_04810 [Bacilli bacterium]|nr:hypothetical protein [Bacilli bacterium]